jgi:hypothetical protein
MKMEELILKDEKFCIEIGEVDVRNLSFGTGLVLRLY